MSSMGERIQSEVREALDGRSMQSCPSVGVTPGVIGLFFFPWRGSGHGVVVAARLDGLRCSFFPWRGGGHGIAVVPRMGGLHC